MIFIEITFSTNICNIKFSTNICNINLNIRNIIKILSECYFHSIDEITVMHNKNANDITVNIEKEIIIQKENVIKQIIKQNILNKLSHKLE